MEFLLSCAVRDTHMANYLLLRAYTAGAKHFADDAVSELCDKPWRFECGYADSTYWIAIQLIEAVVPLCSDENRVRLENTILEYVPRPRTYFPVGINREGTLVLLCYRASRLNCGVRKPRLVMQSLNASLEWRNLLHRNSKECRL